MRIAPDSVEEEISSSPAVTPDVSEELTTHLPDEFITPTCPPLLAVRTARYCPTTCIACTAVLSGMTNCSSVTALSSPSGTLTRESTSVEVLTMIKASSPAT